MASNRTKLCKAEGCKTKFTPMNSLQRACSVPCALKIGIAKVAEKRESETMAMKRRVLGNDRLHQLKRTQAVFNQYIRLRDADQPCISCGRFHNGQYHAGHYRTVKAHPELRFNELNCHKQCAPCNNHLSGNITEYRLNLIEKIGELNMNWLEGPHEAHKLTLDEIKEIRDYFRSKIKLLESELVA